MGPVSEGGGHRSPGVLDVDPTSSRAVADLCHPHLTAMKSVPDGLGVEPELAAGCSLAELIQAGEVPLRISLRILLDVLSGIAAIHHAKVDGKRVGFVHGEVAPANIIVGRDGVARLVPLSRGEGANDSNLVGYQAPELLLGDAVDQRADVFSAGVLLWEAMSGKRLFRDTPAEEIVIQLIGGKVLPPPAPRDAPWAAELSEVAMRAIDADPTQRWPHVGALGSTIENIAHIYVAVPAELATFVTRSMTGSSQTSFTDEVTAKRHTLAERSPSAAPESLSAVSTPVYPDPAPMIAIPLSPAPLVPASVPVPISSLEIVPPERSDLSAGDFTESLPGVPLRGMSGRRRWMIVGGVLAASVVLALLAGRKLLRSEGMTTVLPVPGLEIARPAAAAATPRESPPPAPLPTAAAIPVAVALPPPPPAAAPPPPTVAPPPPTAAPPSASPLAKPAHPTARPAPPPVAAPPPIAAPPPPAVRPAPPLPPSPAPKARPAADQFGI